MPPIVATIDVDRPAEEVFAYATDPTRFTEWQKGVVSGRMDSTDTPAVGDRCVTTRRIGFADRPSTSELVQYEPPHRWSVRGMDGPIRARVDVTVEERSEERSQLTIAVDFEGHGIGRLLVPLVVRREAEKEMPTNVAALKHQMEKTPRWRYVGAASAGACPGVAHAELVALGIGHEDPGRAVL